jgi:hypothetical protein
MFIHENLSHHFFMFSSNMKEVYELRNVFTHEPFFFISVNNPTSHLHNFHLFNYFFHFIFTALNISCAIFQYPFDSCLLLFPSGFLCLGRLAITGFHNCWVAGPTPQHPTWRTRGKILTVLAPQLSLVHQMWAVFSFPSFLTTWQQNFDQNTIREETTWEVILKWILGNRVWWCGLDLCGSGEGPVGWLMWKQ